MSELRDYQRVMVDNLIEDVVEIFDLDTLRARFETRIEAYDRERWEQIERDLPGAVVKAMEGLR